LIFQIETIFLVISTEKERRIESILCKKWGLISVTYWLLCCPSSIPTMSSASKVSTLVTLSAHLNLSSNLSVFEGGHFLIRVHLKTLDCQCHLLYPNILPNSCNYYKFAKMAIL